MVLLQLTPGDEHVAREAGLRGQQVVEAAVEAVIGDIEADGKQPPRRIVEETKVDVGEAATGRCQPVEFGEPLVVIE